MRLSRYSGIVVLSAVMAGCQTQPAATLDRYVSANATAPPQEIRESAARGPIDAGLVLVHDRRGPDSSPALSERGQTFLADRVTQRVQGMLPIRLVKTLAVGDTVDPATGVSAWTEQARAQGLPYILLAIVSQAEREVPMRVPLLADPEQGGGRPLVPGFEMRTNALVELALVDVGTGRLVTRGEGRAWNRLNRLYVPMQTNGYPVIHQSLRVAPIYPSEADAKDVARSLAGDEAAEQAVVDARSRWSGPALN
ncbi:MAG: hypothetical protein U0172_12760 [Nitrospiraceae bacterium]